LQTNLMAKITVKLSTLASTQQSAEQWSSHAALAPVQLNSSSHPMTCPWSCWIRGCHCSAMLFVLLNPTGQRDKSMAETFTSEFCKQNDNKKSTWA
jgi:hypothetical protein